MNYLVSQPGRNLQIARGRDAAAHLAQALARRTGRLAHIHLVATDRCRSCVGGPTLRRGALLAIVAPNGAMEYRGAIGGMGDILTDMACSDTHIATTWRERNNATITAGTQAAIVGAAAAGLLGGVVKRPLVGAILGAAIGWAGYAVWTAPYQISS